MMHYDPQLPKPGHYVTIDYRSEDNRAQWQAQKGPVKLLQWNIERGYQLFKIIAELRRLDADVLGLQEVDILCDRTGGQDVGRAIAQALGYNYVFLCEFEEIHSPLRDSLSQGGGVHGNAILTKFDIATVTALEHSCHPVDWENPVHPLARKEPRKGRRMTLAAKLNTSQGPLLCYCCHLEVFCGLLGRVMQFADVMKHCREQPTPHQVVFGDLNTMANGIARLSPNYCCDKMRWLTLGWSEGEWWARFIFAVTGEHQAAGVGKVAVNGHLLRLGLPPDVACAMVNPGFFDPFDPVEDVTLDNPKYRFCGLHLMTGKLDWLLMRNMELISKAMGNHDYAASDHKWLMAVVNLKEGAPPPPSKLRPLLWERPALLLAAAGIAVVAVYAGWLRLGFRQTGAP